MSQAVWITGLGAVSCLGSSVQTLWDSRNRTGINEAGLGIVPGQFEDNALEFAQASAREAMDQAGWDRLGPEDGLILATTTGFILKWDRSFAEFSNGNVSLAEFKKDFDELLISPDNAGIDHVKSDTCNLIPK